MVIVHLQQAFKILVNGPKGPLRNRVGKNMKKKMRKEGLSNTTRRKMKKMSG